MTCNESHDLPMVLCSSLVSDLLFIWEQLSDGQRSLANNFELWKCKGLVVQRMIGESI